jgi:peptidoglycan hydrolase CwlO-like protein
MQKHFHTTSQKLNNTANQSYLLTGAVSNIKSELQTAASERKGHQNQIDIMAGSLAHLIQEVKKVQNEFSTINEGIKANQKGIGKLTEELKIQIRELNLGIEKMLDDLDQQVKTINQKLDEQDKNSLKARQMISSDLDDIKDEFAKLKNKISSLDKDITALNSDVKKLNIKVDNILIEE